MLAIENISDLMIVEQLPIIKEQIKLIKDELQEKVNAALELECTESTVKNIKSVRADLNKNLILLEQKRKDIKRKILEPYNTFEKIYKMYITDIFISADKKLKERIDETENRLKEIKRKEITEYFNEYCISKDIDFLNFPKANINITLSVSRKSLRVQVKDFIDRIADDISFIKTQEDAAEILIEYKTNLNLAKSMNIVNKRKKDLIVEQKQLEILKNKDNKRKQTEIEIEQIIKKENEINEERALTFPKVIEPNKVNTEKIYELNFTVKGTKEKLKQLKEFLDREDYNYE